MKHLLYVLSMLYQFQYDWILRYRYTNTH